MKIKQYISSLLVFFGLRLILLNSRTKVQSFLLRLRPILTEHELIRVGGFADGGYLFPKSVGNIDAVFSPGVADNANFEKHFADLGIPCFLIDGSIEKPPISHPNFYFEPIWLGKKSFESREISLEDWLEKSTYKNSKNLILSMDIEGAEYECLADVPAEILSSFKVIVIEFHYLSKIFESTEFTRMEKTLDSLQKNHYLIHSHVNNCCKPIWYKFLYVPEVVELTFIRKDLVNKTNGFRLHPHPLDEPNLPSEKTYFFKWN